MEMKRLILIYMIMCIPTLKTYAIFNAGDACDDVLQYTPYAALFTLKACGVDSRDGWARLAATAAASFAVSAGTTYALKKTVREWRPDHSDRRSFPSGHATIAFAGATMLRREYAAVSPWIAVGGYAVATFTAADRVRRDRHHWYDVAAGAAIGALGTELTCYLADKLFPKIHAGSAATIVFTGTRLDVAVAF
ncbi:MAG: phosphatase PAP2 family protein [Prevotella sp.]